MVFAVWWYYTTKNSSLCTAVEAVCIWKFVTSHICIYFFFLFFSSFHTVAFFSLRSFRSFSFSLLSIFCFINIYIQYSHCTPATESYRYVCIYVALKPLKPLKFQVENSSIAYIHPKIEWWCCDISIYCTHASNFSR